MTEFLTAYGLWLLIALLVVIALVFVLSGKKTKLDEAPKTVAPPVETPRVAMTPPMPIIDPMPILDPVPFVDPTPVIPVAVPDAPAPVATPHSADNLLQLKGVGPKLVTVLYDLGVTRFAQIAAWTDSDLAVIDTKLGTFKGRPTRDHWIDQARYLANGDIAGFESTYGKL